MLNHKTDIKIQDLIQKLTDNKIPFAAFSLPGENNIHVFIQIRKMPVVFAEFKDIEHRTGFVFTPYASVQFQNNYFIEPDYIINDPIQLDHVLKIIDGVSFKKEKVSDFKMISTEKDLFINHVFHIQQLIKDGIVDKVVLSRIKKIRFDKVESHISKIFQFLNQKNLEAFCYLTFIPGAGMWTGASPEPLIQLENNTYRTVALAGTKYLNGLSVDKISWTEKEIVEQAWVSDFIKEQLASLHIPTPESKGPYTFQAAKVVHLKTDFKFNSSNSGSSLGEIIKALHPTPSVCGYPSDVAHKIITTTEQHSRAFYTGLLGPVNYNDSSQLFVNLRCMQVLKDDIMLYSGAGITSGSDPESEWKETEQKLGTMLAVIQMQEIVT